ncbi:MAG: hypothetical protein DRP65_09605 [Planctomycetota bacterium]|nr:MAG: hypothetical protein DRP65_09605 [Planctomycetota bacterium]
MSDISNIFGDFELLDFINLDETMWEDVPVEFSANMDSKTEILVDLWVVNYHKETVEIESSLCLSIEKKSSLCLVKEIESSLATRVELESSLCLSVEKQSSLATQIELESRLF